MIEGTLWGKWSRGRLQRTRLDNDRDNVKTWTDGFILEEAFRTTEDRTVWWKIIHDTANPRTLSEEG